MNGLLLTTMVLGAAAVAVDETKLKASAEFIQIESTMNDIADRLSAVKLKEIDFNFGEFDWISNNASSDDHEPLVNSMLETPKDDEDIFEPFDEKTEDRIIERVPGLKKNPPPTSHLHKKRTCKTFEDTRLTINAKDKTAVASGETWESCLQSCEENLFCAQVIFDKKKNKCLGYRMANDKTDSSSIPENFMSGHCKTEVEEAALKSKSAEQLEDGVVEDTSFVQTEDKSQVELTVDQEFEKQMKMEEQLAMEEELAKAERLAKAEQLAKEEQKAMKPKSLIPKKPSEKSGLKLRQRISKKCTTFETENLMKKGSLLQMGKKLLSSETTGDFLTCLQKCQRDTNCKQVVYDKQASQCYKHDEVAVKKSDSKGTKYIAATCQ